MHGNTTDYRQTGFSLMEVLVTMVVLSVGLLGIAGMQASGMRNNHAAYTKTQATNLAMDMAERIRANPLAQADYAGFDSSTPPANSPGCITTAAGCTATQLVTHDTFEWSQPFNTETKPILPAGQGLIAQVGSQFTITILWREVAYDGIDFIDCIDEQAADIACLQLSFEP